MPHNNSKVLAVLFTQVLQKTCIVNEIDFFEIISLSFAKFHPPIKLPKCLTSCCLCIPPLDLYSFDGSAVLRYCYNKPQFQAAFLFCLALFLSSNCSFLVNKSAQFVFLVDFLLILCHYFLFQGACRLNVTLLRPSTNRIGTVYIRGIFQEGFFVSSSESSFTFLSHSIRTQKQQENYTKNNSKNYHNLIDYINKHDFSSNSVPVLSGLRKS